MYIIRWIIYGINTKILKRLSADPYTFIIICYIIGLKIRGKEKIEIRYSLNSKRVFIKQKMKTKKIISLLLTFCISLGVFCIVPKEANAEYILDKFTLTGNITPTVGQTLKFAAVSNDPTYTLVQIWGKLKDGEETSKIFSDNAMFNKDIEDENLLPESERVFTDDAIYVYQIMIMKYGSAIEFADTMTATVGGLNMAYVGGEDDTCGFALAFKKSSGSHIHRSAAVYKHDANYHWLTCYDSKCGYKFDSEQLINGHNFDAAYKCKMCGYTLPESMATKITKQPSDVTVSCGDTVTFTVGATGSGLKYNWRFGNDSYSLYNTDDYANSGMKISGNQTNTLKFENVSGRALKYLGGVYCYISGNRGSAKSTVAKITFNHNISAYSPIDGNGHRVLCLCGETVKEMEGHTYGSDNVCTFCGYTKGSTATTFKSGVLSLPGFAETATTYAASESARFEGTGLNSTKCKFVWYSQSDSELSNTYKFETDKIYTLRIYPSFETNFDIAKGQSAAIIYGGESRTCYCYSDTKGKYFELRNLKPSNRLKMTFDPNGGSGTQDPQYADNTGYVLIPDCTYTKDDDEFYAWRIDGRIYYTGSGDKIQLSDDKVATAIWKSQLTKDITLTLDGIKENDKPTDVNFSTPAFADYKIETIKWYKGDDAADRNLISNDTVITPTDDYTVKITLKSNNFASLDDLNVTLNGVVIRNEEDADGNITKTYVQRTFYPAEGITRVTVTAHITNYISFNIAEPTNGIILQDTSEIRDNNKSDKYTTTVTTYWSATENGSYSGNINGTVAEYGKTYYLVLNINSKKENTILGRSTIRINGKDYPIKKADVQPSGLSWITAIIPFTASIAKVGISENNGMLAVTSPKKWNVTFIAAFYNSDGTLGECLTESNVELSGGTQTLNPLDIFKDDNRLRFAEAINPTKHSYTAKIFIFDEITRMKPVSEGCLYTFRAK